MPYAKIQKHRNNRSKQRHRNEQTSAIFNFMPQILPDNEIAKGINS